VVKQRKKITKKGSRVKVLKYCNVKHFGQILTFGGLSAIIYCNNLMILTSGVIINSLIYTAFHNKVPNYGNAA
jgi:hypothetical protein